MTPTGTEANYMSRVHAGLAKLEGTPSSGGGATSSPGGTSGSYNPQTDPNNPEYRPSQSVGTTTIQSAVQLPSSGGASSWQRTTAPTSWQSEAQIREAIFRGEATSMDLAVFRNAQLGKSTTVHYQSPSTKSNPLIPYSPGYGEQGSLSDAQTLSILVGGNKWIRSSDVIAGEGGRDYTGEGSAAFNEKWGKYIDPNTGYFTGTSEQFAQAQADYAKVSTMQTNIAPYVDKSGNVDVVAAVQGGVSLNELAASTGQPVSVMRQAYLSGLLVTMSGGEGVNVFGAARAGATASQLETFGITERGAQAAVTLSPYYNPNTMEFDLARAEMDIGTGAADIGYLALGGKVPVNIETFEMYKRNAPEIAESMFVSTGLHRPMSFEGIDIETGRISPTWTSLGGLTRTFGMGSEIVTEHTGHIPIVGFVVRAGSMGVLDVNRYWEKHGAMSWLAVPGTIAAGVATTGVGQVVFKGAGAVGGKVASWAATRTPTLYKLGSELGHIAALPARAVGYGYTKVVKPAIVGKYSPVMGKNTPQGWAVRATGAGVKRAALPIDTRLAAIQRGNIGAFGSKVGWWKSPQQIKAAAQITETQRLNRLYEKGGYEVKDLGLRGEGKVPSQIPVNKAIEAKLGGYGGHPLSKGFLDRKKLN